MHIILFSASHCWSLPSPLHLHYGSLTIFSEWWRLYREKAKAKTPARVAVNGAEPLTLEAQPQQTRRQVRQNGSRLHGTIMERAPLRNTARHHLHGDAHDRRCLASVREDHSSSTAWTKWLLVHYCMGSYSRPVHIFAGGRVLTGLISGQSYRHRWASIQDYILSQPLVGWRLLQLQAVDSLPLLSPTEYTKQYFSSSSSGNVHSNGLRGCRERSGLPLDFQGYVVVVDNRIEITPRATGANDPDEWSHRHPVASHRCHFVRDAFACYQEIEPRQAEEAVAYWSILTWVFVSVHSSKLTRSIPRLIHPSQDLHRSCHQNHYHIWLRRCSGCYPSTVSLDGHWAGDGHYAVLTTCLLAIG